MPPRPGRGSYTAVAETLLSALDQGDGRCALAGGLAVWAHGYVASPPGVDVIVGFPLEEARRRLAARGVGAMLKRGDPLEGDFSCLKGTLRGIPFDVIPQLVAVPWEKAVPLRLGGGTLRVVDLQTLLALKLRAGGPQDLLDVAMLVLLHPEAETGARELAIAYRAAERLESWLRDPRTRAKAREIAAHERSAPRRRRSPL